MMEGRLIFCADAILRFCSDYDDTTAIPLLSIQKTVAGTDPFFLLRFFHHQVEIEEGTTLANIFFAIEPWQALLSAYLGRDVSAYIEEIKKPSAPAKWDLEWIGIERRSVVYRAYQHEDLAESEDLTAWLNRERIPTDEFDIENHCDASGFIIGGTERWSLSENVHEIKNLPVVLNPKQVLITSPKEALFSESVAGVNHGEHSHFIYGETSFSFAEVMDAIFISGLFFYAPQDAAASMESLQESLEELQEDLAADETATDADNEDRKPNIEIADGAFDSAVTHMASEAENWQLIKEQCKQHSFLPVRIGGITRAALPELRLAGKLIAPSV